MNLTLSTTLWILMLAVGYLGVIYTALWWAQRSREATKRGSL